jgi:hypothetical protein
LTRGKRIKDAEKKVPLLRRLNHETDLALTLCRDSETPEKVNFTKISLTNF